MSDLQSMLEWIGGASIQLLVAAALAWLLCVTVARKSPALRHAIWVVVLLKCFVPPSVTAPWSLSQLWVSPAVGQAPPDDAASNPELQADRATVLRTVSGEVDRKETLGLSGDVARHGSQSRGTGVDAIGNTVAPLREATADQTRRSGLVDDPVAPERQARPDLPTPTPRNITAAEAFRRWWMGTVSTASLMFVWVGGAIVALALAALSIVRVTAKVRRGEQIDEGPAAVAVEEAALKLGLKSPPKLVATDDAVTPFVAGLFRPTVVIPRSILESLPADELRLVVWHEVVHVARRDAWTSLLQLFSVAAFWFHPAVWWAAAAVRREREACCDETVLRTTRAEPSTYGDAFLHVLSAVRGRAIAAPAWAAPAGVFERDSDLRSRIEQIMSFRPTPSKRVTVGLVATLFALAVVPMGVRANDPWTGVEESDIPTIVSISPSIGATDVDPEISEIKVIFDRPMESGFSWTGSGPTYPPMPDGLKPSWSDDKTTCTLPVALEAAQFYRIGINSKSYQNFRSADGVPVKPAVLTFTTRGANAAAVGRMEAPKIIAIDPPNGATGVHPLTTKEIRVTFDRPMGGGMSWVGSGEKFPKSPDDRKPQWLLNSRTCVLPVRLDPQHDYQLRFNSDRFQNFQSTEGVPLDPFTYTFRTSSASAAHEVLADSFEKPHRDDIFAEYYGLLLTDRESVTGKYSIKLQKLDPAPNVVVRQPSGDFEFEQSGTIYNYGEPITLPDKATSLRVSAMVKAESVANAAIWIDFLKHTADMRAGRERSWHAVLLDPAVRVRDGRGNDIIFIGRSATEEPVANHGWSSYKANIQIPDDADSVEVAVELRDGKTLWVDDLTIAAEFPEAEGQSKHGRETEATSKAATGLMSSPPLTRPTVPEQLEAINLTVKAVEDELADAIRRHGSQHAIATRLGDYLSLLAERRLAVANGGDILRGAETDVPLGEPIFEDDFQDGVLQRWTRSVPHRVAGKQKVWWAKNAAESSAKNGNYLAIYRDDVVFPGGIDVTEGPRSSSGDPGVRPGRMILPSGVDQLALSVKTRLEPQAVAHVKIKFFGELPENNHSMWSATTTALVAKGSADPTAYDMWQSYRTVLDIPTGATQCEIEFSLQDGRGFKFDDLTIHAVANHVSANEPEPVGQASPDAAAGDVDSLSAARMKPRSAASTRDDVIAPSRQSVPDLHKRDALGGTPARPPSIDATLFHVHDKEGLLFEDDFTWLGLEPSLWKRSNVPGVVLKHRTDIGNRTATPFRSLEMRKSVDRYFPIASWSRRVEHSDPDATHVQVRAYVKAEEARKAVLDVLFLDEDGEWIRHQWVDYIGDERLQSGVGEGRHFQNGDLNPGEPGVTHTWYPYGGAVAIPEGTKYIEVSAQMYGPGIVFIDDIEVRYVDVSGAQPALGRPADEEAGDAKRTKDPDPDDGAAKNEPVAPVVDQVFSLHVDSPLYARKELQKWMKQTAPMETDEALAFLDSQLGRVRTLYPDNAGAVRKYAALFGQIESAVRRESWDADRAEFLEKLAVKMKERILVDDDIEWDSLDESDWSRIDAHGIDLVWDDSKSKSGNRSLKLQNTDDAATNGSWTRRVKHTLVDEQQLSFYASVGAERVEKFVLKVGFLDANERPISSEIVDNVGTGRNDWLRSQSRPFEGGIRLPARQSASHTWTRYGGTVDIPTGTHFFETALLLQGPGTAWVDDVLVKYADPPMTLQ